MKTVITSRKTPHAVVDTLFGTKGPDVIHAWCFEDPNDENSRLVKRWIPKSRCYVKENNQELPDYMFREYDIRKYHVDVWNAKSRNWKKLGKFSTNYQLKMHLERLREIEASLRDMWSANLT